MKKSTDKQDKTGATPWPLYVSRDTTQSAEWTVCDSHGHQPNAEQAGVGHSVGVARFFHKQKAEEYIRMVNELETLKDAVEKFHLFYFNDLAKSNPGFIGKLVLQDYGAMNEAYIAMEKARCALAQSRRK